MCEADLPTNSFFSHKNGGFSGALCRDCTVADNKLRRQDPQKHREILAARQAARKVRSAQHVATITEKSCTKCGAPKPLGEFREHRGLYGRSSWCIQCERDYSNKWVADHHDEYRAQCREKWAANPLPPDKKAEAAARARAWYAANTERAKCTTLQWMHNNPLAFTAIQTRRRARKASVINTLTKEEWAEVLEVFDHKCAYCLRGDVVLTMDHVLPISKGGPHSVENVVPACKSCNYRKGNRLIFKMLEKSA